MSRRAYLPYILLAVISALYLYPFVRVLWRIGDEGTLVYGAQRVAEGAVPYRDFFEVMGPGSFYWLGFFFKIFGTSWMVARVLLLITAVATTLIVYWLARRLDSAFAALPAVMTLVLTIPLWAATNHHWDSNLFALLAFAAFLSWLDRSKRWLLIGAGVLSGVTTLFMQQKGLLWLLALVLTLWALRRGQPDFLPSVVRLVAGYASVVAAEVLGFYLAGALPDFFYANVIWPISNYRNVNSVPYAFGLRGLFWSSWVDSLLLLFRPSAAHIVADLFLLPFLAIVGLPVLLLGLAVTRRAAAFSPATLPYWIAGFALWFSEIHRSDVNHLIYGSPVLLVLCVYLCGQRQNRFWRYAVRALAFSIVLFAAFDALVAQAARTKIITRRGTVYVHVADAALDFLDQQVKAGEEVFVYPYYPMYYFLSGAANPTKFSILMYHINTEAQFREAVAALERRKVKYVLWDGPVDGQNLKNWFPAYQQPSQDKLIIEPYLTEHYDLLGYRNGFRLLRRKESSESAIREFQPRAAGAVSPVRFSMVWGGL